MTDPAASFAQPSFAPEHQRAAALAAQVTQTIDRLRQLTQIDIQSQWRCCQQDFAPETATQFTAWQSWDSASLNDRQHIAWEKGQRVMWLGQRLIAPDSLQGYPLTGLTLRLALTWWAELAQVYVNGKLVQEGDLFDHSARILLVEQVQPGEAIDLAIRLVSPGHDNGALVRSRCIYEQPSKAPCPEPGFVADELAVLQIYLLAFQPEQLEAVGAAVAALDWAAVGDRAQFDAALSRLRTQLTPLGDWLKQHEIRLLGHAHLDMAWLWDVAETWQAAERTFKSVLQLQQEFPELIFCHSTPALYAWMEENRPALFAEIQAQIAADRWEVTAGLWIEPELNLISGESIARQVLYGQRYVYQKFGRVSPIAWLPDSFGFCWQLPQILRQGGVNYFVTQKLRWNDTTRFPHELFWWQAADGTPILSLHSAPIGEGIDPVKMAQYACEWETQTGLSSCLWLPGVGDHGGGPTRDMLQVARRWQQSPFFPKLRFGQAAEFLDQQAERARSLTPSSNISSAAAQPQFNAGLPVWNTDLYLEFHRGCYTTHGDQKRDNRCCERLLYEAEVFSTLASLLLGVAYPQAALETAWKQVLFNQFHDILPGSAIPDVYVDANAMWQQAKQTAEQTIDRALHTLAQAVELPLPPHPGARAVIVFNALSWARSEWVGLPNVSQGKIYDSQGQPVKQQWRQQQLQFWAEAPAIGYRLFWWVPAVQETIDGFHHPDSASAELGSGYGLENDRLRVTIDPSTGNIAELYDKVQQRQVLSGAGNQLQAFRDSGQYWDAWNIDPGYAQHPLPPARLLNIAAEPGAIVVQRQIGQSTFVQTYHLEEGAPLLKIHTIVDWQERHVLVKAAFPLNLTAEQATYEIPYGAIDRPTRPQTELEKAQWEVPALNWADLSSGDYGVSLLSDYKHGYDCQPSQIRLSLLRGSEFPDPQADLGRHEFTYAIYPHAGDWRSAHTVQQGYAMNQPLRAVMLDDGIYDGVSGSTAKLPADRSLLQLPTGLILSALKRSEEDANQWIIRFYEAHGEPVEFCSDAAIDLAFSPEMAFSPAINGCSLRRTNLLENPLENTLESEESNSLLNFTVQPWQIITLKLGGSPT